MELVLLLMNSSLSLLPSENIAEKLLLLPSSFINVSLEEVITTDESDEGDDNDDNLRVLDGK